MIFQPSQEVHDRQIFELSGVFIDRCLNEPHLWMVAKLPMNVIREISVGAPIALRVWVAEVEEHLIPVFGLIVYDDAAAPRTYFGSCRGVDETNDLRSILLSGSIPLQIHNENCFPVFNAECRFDQELALPVLAVPVSAPTASKAGDSIREKACDAVQASLSSSSDQVVRASCILPLRLVNAENLTIHVIGSGTISLDDTNEGNELERMTFQAFESMFPYGAFISPQVGGGKKARELCDVLAVSRVRECEEEGIFVVQNKVASAFPEGLKRTTVRRAKTIQNNIIAGISQLEGAIKAILRGETVHRIEDGTSIEVDPPYPELDESLEPLNLRERATKVGHGLVVISDMHEMVDWDEVYMELGRVWISTRYYCQVLDLQELRRLVTHSKGRPALLESFLCKRAEVMVERKTPFVRFQLILES
jgi:hypothetical protein